MYGCAAAWKVMHHIPHCFGQNPSKLINIKKTIRLCHLCCVKQIRTPSLWITCLLSSSRKYESHKKFDLVSGIYGVENVRLLPQIDGPHNPLPQVFECQKWNRIRTFSWDLRWHHHTFWFWWIVCLSSDARLLVCALARKLSINILLIHWL